MLLSTGGVLTFFIPTTVKTDTKTLSLLAQSIQSGEVTLHYVGGSSDKNRINVDVFREPETLNRPNGEIIWESDNPSLYEGTKANHEMLRHFANMDYRKSPLTDIRIHMRQHSLNEFEFDVFIGYGWQLYVIPIVSSERKFTESGDLFYYDISCYDSIRGTSATIEIRLTYTVLEFCDANNKIRMYEIYNMGIDDLKNSGDKKSDPYALYFGGKLVDATYIDFHPTFSEHETVGVERAWEEVNNADTLKSDYDLKMGNLLSKYSDESSIPRSSIYVPADDDIEYFPPDPPTLDDLEETGVEGEVSLNWSDEDGATYYKVYRSLSEITSVTSATKIWETEETEYIDQTIISNDTYYYAVTAVNGTGSSEISNYESIEIIINPLSAPIIELTQDGMDLEIDAEWEEGRGHYQGVYTFWNNTIDSSISDWDETETYGTTSIISSYDGHNNLMDIYDTSSGGSVQASHGCIETDSGTVEMLGIVPDNDKAVYIRILDGTTLAAEFGVESGNFRSYDSSGYEYHSGIGTPSDNTWYVFKIIFESDQSVSFYVNDTLYETGDNLANSITNINIIGVRSGSSRYNYHAYVDSIDISWENNTHHYYVVDDITEYEQPEVWRYYLYSEDITVDNINKAFMFEESTSNVYSGFIDEFDYGNYKGRHTFYRDELGSKPEEFDIINSTSGTQKVISSHEDHKKVYEIFDNSNTGNWVMNVNQSIETNRSFVQTWFMTTDNSTENFIDIYNGTTKLLGFGTKNYNWTSYDYTHGYTTLNSGVNENQWYLLTVVYDFEYYNSTTYTNNASFYIDDEILSSNVIVDTNHHQITHTYITTDYTGCDYKIYIDSYTPEMLDPVTEEVYDLGDIAHNIDTFNLMEGYYHYAVTCKFNNKWSLISNSETILKDFGLPEVTDFQYEEIDYEVLRGVTNTGYKYVSGEEFYSGSGTDTTLYHVDGDTSPNDWVLQNGGDSINHYTSLTQSTGFIMDNSGSVASIEEYSFENSTIDSSYDLDSFTITTKFAIYSANHPLRLKVYIGGSWTDWKTIMGGASGTSVTKTYEFTSADFGSLTIEDFNDDLLVQYESTRDDGYTCYLSEVYVSEIDYSYDTPTDWKTVTSEEWVSGETEWMYPTSSYMSYLSYNREWDFYDGIYNNGATNNSGHYTVIDDWNDTTDYIYEYASPYWYDSCYLELSFDEIQGLNNGSAIVKNVTMSWIGYENGITSSRITPYIRFNDHGTKSNFDTSMDYFLRDEGETVCESYTLTNEDSQWTDQFDQNKTIDEFDDYFELWIQKNFHPVFVYSVRIKVGYEYYGELDKYMTINEVGFLDNSTYIYTDTTDGDEQTFELQDVDTNLNTTYPIMNITVEVYGKEGNNTGSLECMLYDGETWHEYVDLISGIGNTTLTWHNLTIDTSNWNVSLDDWDDFRIRIRGYAGNVTGEDNYTAIYGLRTYATYEWETYEQCFGKLNFTWNDMNSTFISNTWYNMSENVLVYRIYSSESPINSTIGLKPIETTVENSTMVQAFNTTAYYYITVGIYNTTLGSLESEYTACNNNSAIYTPIQINPQTISQSLTYEERYWHISLYADSDYETMANRLGQPQFMWNHYRDTWFVQGLTGVTNSIFIDNYYVVGTTEPYTKSIITEIIRDACQDVMYGGVIYKNDLVSMWVEAHGSSEFSRDYGWWVNSWQILRPLEVSALWTAGYGGNHVGVVDCKDAQIFPLVCYECRRDNTMDDSFFLDGQASGYLRAPNKVPQTYSSVYFTLLTAVMVVGVPNIGLIYNARYRNLFDGDVNLLHEFSVGTFLRLLNIYHFFLESEGKFSRILNPLWYNWMIISGNCFSLRGFGFMWISLSRLPYGWMGAGFLYCSRDEFALGMAYVATALLGGLTPFYRGFYALGNAVRWKYLKKYPEVDWQDRIRDDY